jgi:4-methylaminobutanoate oxidase (formaldehyde-forming)
VRALRITYVGELGWELHVPSDSAGAVYDALFEAGRPFGIVNAGYRAIESLRLEKAYRVWGSDIGPDFTPLEAGLGWAVKLKKPIPFLGREALERQAAEGPLKRRFACFTVTDPGAFLFGRETIYRDGERVGWLTSGGYGHTVERMIGFGYVRSASGVTDESLATGKFELEVATRHVPCEIHPRTVLYDPKNERVKA